MSAIPEFHSFVEAAFWYLRCHWSEDCNPVPVVVAGVHYHACGPTTGLWLEANGLKPAAKIAGVTFA